MTTPKNNRRHRNWRSNRKATEKPTTPEQITEMGYPLKEKETHHVRVYFNNIHGITPADRMEKHTRYNQQWKQKEIDILGLAETNVNWRLSSIREDFHHATTPAWKFYKATTSTCKAKTSNRAQPGGTAQITNGAFLTKIHAVGADNTYGRWSYQIYRGRKGKKLAILTAYCPSPKGKTGPRMVIQQQRATMIAEGAAPKNPKARIDPTKHFYKELGNLLRTWKNEKYEYLIMMDANSTIEETYLRDLMSTYGLFDIHKELLDQPAWTFERGARRIDVMLGTRGVLASARRCGTEELHEVAKSDHRAIWADYDFRHILGKAPPDLTAPPMRDLYSHIPRHVKAYKDAMIRYFEQHNIPHRLRALNKIRVPTNATIREYEKLDRDITRAMLAAERALKKRYTLPWSPTLQRAIDQVDYWSAMLRRKKSNRPPTHFIKRMSKKMERQWDADYRQTTQEIYHKQQDAYKHLRKIRREAKDIREQFLEELAMAYEKAGIQRAETKIKQLHHQEKQRNTARKLKYRLKQPKVGQVTKVWIPANPMEEATNAVKDWIEETDPRRVEKAIMEQNIKHFGQAENTPFTAPPLKYMQSIRHPMARKIMEGHAAALEEQMIYLETKQLLCLLALSPGQEDCVSKLDAAAMKKAYKNWKEKTATSPSGRHLGHFHALLKPDGIDRRKKRDQHGESDENEGDDETGKDPAELIWKIHAEMLHIVVRWEYIPKQWKRVLTLMLEKKLGEPKIHRLRPINIYESDLNYLLKKVIAKDLIQYLEDRGKLHDAQWGSRPDRRATDALFKKMLALELARMARQLLGVIYLDARACFDRIPSNFSMLVLRKFGVPETLCELMKQQLDNAEFSIRTQLGASPNFYRHTAEKLIHGNGQGSSSSPALWAMISSLLYECFEKSNNGATFWDPYSDASMTTWLEGFVDDNTMLVSCLREFLLDEAITTAVQTWERLLFSTGGALALDKCKFHAISYKVDKHNKTIMKEPEEQGYQVLLTAGSNTQTEPIKQLRPDESSRMLGGHFTPLGIFDTEVTYLHAKALHWAQQISSGGITKEDARIAYQSYLITAISYSGPVISLTEKQCDKIQREATAAYLQSQGVSKKFPRDVAFAPISIGGLGMHNLYTEQAKLHLTETVRHIRYRTTVGNMMRLDLHWAQLISGLSGQFWKDTTTSVEYMKEFQCIWGTRIRTALADAEMQLWIYNAWKPKPQREEDSFIMDHFIKYGYKTAELAHLNRCRIWLRVMTVADIATADGKYINEQYVRPAHKRPMESRWRWPRQLRPIQEHVDLWRRALKKTILQPSSKKLKTPLGAWSNDNKARHQIREWTMDRTRKYLFWKEKRRFEILYNTPAACYYECEGEPTAEPTGLPCDVDIHEDYLEAQPPAPIQSRIQVDSSWKNVFRVRSSTNVSKRDLRHRFKTEQLFMATDGSLVNTQGTYAWIVCTMDEQTLASGTGPVRGAAISMTSHRCEMYAMLAAMVFLDTLGIQDEQFEAIIIYSDSLPVVNWMLDKPTENYRHADDDLGRCIKEITQHLEVKWTCMHVKSHQKLTPVSPLSVRMNFTVDKMAANQQKYTSEIQCRQPNNWEPIGAALVQNGTLATKTVNAIRQATATPKLRVYQNKKFGWNKNIHNTIDKEVLRRFRNQLSITEAWFSTRMQCRLLPTNSFLHRQQRKESPKCQACGDEWEDILHILKCPKRQAMRAKLMEIIRKYFDESQTPTVIREIINTAIGNNIWGDNVPMITHERTKQLIMEQSQIGWIHLCHGFVSTALVNFMNEYYEQQQKKKWTGTRWAVSLCCHLCRWTYSQWINRCDMEHTNKNGMTTTQEMNLKTAKRWYDRRHELGLDRGNFFHEPWEHFRVKPPSHIQHWLDINLPALERLWDERPKTKRQTNLFEAWGVSQPKQNKK